MTCAVAIARTLGNGGAQRMHAGSHGSSARVLMRKVDMQFLGQFLGLFAALLLVFGATHAAYARPASPSAAIAQHDIFAIPRDATDWSALAYATGDLTLYGAADAGNAFDRTLRSTRAAQPHSMGRQVARSSTAAAGSRDSLRNIWSMALVSLALVGYQLRRKHRLLRPQRITF